MRKGLDAVGGAANITIVNCQSFPQYERRTLDEIATQEGTSPIRLYMRIVRSGGATIVCKAMKESDIRTFYREPWVMVGSDGEMNPRHPRGAGTYPRVLGRYVRELRRWRRRLEK